MGWRGLLRGHCFDTSCMLIAHPLSCPGAPKGRLLEMRPADDQGPKTSTTSACQLQLHQTGATRNSATCPAPRNRGRGLIIGIFPCREVESRGGEGATESDIHSVEGSRLLFDLNWPVHDVEVPERSSLPQALAMPRSTPLLLPRWWRVLRNAYSAFFPRPPHQTSPVAFPKRELRLWNEADLRKPCSQSGPFQAPPPQPPPFSARPVSFPLGWSQTFCGAAESAHSRCSHEELDDRRHAAARAVKSSTIYVQPLLGPSVAVCRLISRLKGPPRARSLLEQAKAPPVDPSLVTLTPSLSSCT